MAEAMNLKLYLGGSLVESERTLAVIDPSTEEVIAHVPEATPAHVDRAVASARAAFPHWSSLSGSERAVYLDAIAAAIRDRKQPLAELESRNSGKPLPEALWDLDDVSACYEYYATLARELDTKQNEPAPDMPQGTDYKATMRYEAAGVVGAIVPWNYPLLMSTWKLAPALAAGCCVVLKPSELTPLTALQLPYVFNLVGLPAGVVSIVTGAGAVGGYLSQHEGVDKLSFTGSVPTGIKVMTAAAKGVKNVTLELGGKSPAIVFDSCDVERAVEWAMFGCFWTNGQICSATSRLLLQRNIYDKFLQRLVQETDKIKVGGALEEGVKMGPIVSKPQYDRVVGFIERAKAQGAVVAAGGYRPQEVGSRGYFLRPTILTNVSPTSEVWTTEVFGPVLCVRAFDSEEEAVRLANDSEYGLAGAVFGADETQLARVTAALRVGIVWNNCSQPCFSQLPWGGMKRSGVGRDLGRAGFNSYLEVKQVVAHVTTNPLGWYFLQAKL